MMKKYTTEKKPKKARPFTRRAVVTPECNSPSARENTLEEFSEFSEIKKEAQSQRQRFNSLQNDLTIPTTFDQKKFETSPLFQKE